MATNDLKLAGFSDAQILALEAVFAPLNHAHGAESIVVDPADGETLDEVLDRIYEALAEDSAPDEDEDEDGV